MTKIISRNVLSVWLLLIVATMTSWLLGTDHGVTDSRGAAVVILVIAVAKVRLVGRHFMEIREAPLPLAVIFDLWLLAVTTAVLALYLLA